MKQRITRRHFLKKVGLATAAGLTIIINPIGLKSLEASTLKNNSNVCKFKPLCGNPPYHDLKSTDIREFPGDSCNLPDENKYCQRYFENNARLHKHTVLAVTDLIIKKYGGRR